MLSNLHISQSEPTYVQIAQQVRREIQLGRLTPGQRLPSSLDLVKRWGVSYRVVQDALAMLAADGVLHRAPSRGTFVSPKVVRRMVGLVFGPRLADEQAHFYRAAQKALEAEIHARGWACRTYDDFTNSEGMPYAPETQVYQNLASDAQACAFKGLVQFDLGPRGLVHPASQQRVPSVSFTEPQCDSDFELNWTQFGQEAVRFLAGQGCRKIVCLMGIDQVVRIQPTRVAAILRTARELGLPEPSVEWLMLSHSGASFERAAYEQASRIVRQWRDQTANNGRPDGLVVTDDILMRGVALALIENGLMAPGDLKVLVCTCKEVELCYGMPVARHEISARRIAKDMLDLLQKRIAGRSLPKLPIKYAGEIKGDS